MLITISTADSLSIEIKKTPIGDENNVGKFRFVLQVHIEIKKTPIGDENITRLCDCQSFFLLKLKRPR